MAARAQRNYESLITYMSEENYNVGTQFYAKPTYINDPRNFYLMPYQFRHHLNGLTTAGENVKPEELRIDMTVIFTSVEPDLNMYNKLKLDQDIRGAIVNIDNENKCQIYALDYGFIEVKVPIEHIFHPLYEELANIPPLIQHCELDMCAPFGPDFSRNAIQAFKFYIGNEKLSIVIQDKDAQKLKVLVYNSNPDDIGSLLALTHYTLQANETPQQDLNARIMHTPERPTWHYNI